MTWLSDVRLRMAGRTRHCEAGWGLAMVSLLLLGSGPAPAAGREPDVTSAPSHATPMDRIDMANPQPGQDLVTPAVEPEKKFPFFYDSRISAQARTFYFYRDKFDDAISEAWTLGGSVAYASGYAADRLRIGAVGYTSQPLYAPEDRGGTGLLQPGQEGYTLLGQLYGEIKFSDRIFGAFGRKQYNTPYINMNDVRMTPNTFEGI
ncbi:MAG: OprD family outer membrane porin, partial [Chromatiales bacterium]